MGRRLISQALEGDEAALPLVQGIVVGRSAARLLANALGDAGQSGPVKPVAEALVFDQRAVRELEGDSSPAARQVLQWARRCSDLADVDGEKKWRPALADQRATYEAVAHGLAAAGLDGVKVTGCKVDVTEGGALVRDRVIHRMPCACHPAAGAYRAVRAARGNRFARVP
jgi:hypothetical protein